MYFENNKSKYSNISHYHEEHIMLEERLKELHRSLIDADITNKVLSMILALSKKCL